MKVEKLVWSWFDGDGVYTNSAESLEEIIEEIFEYYFDDEVLVAIVKTFSHFEIEVLDQESGSTNLHRVANSNWAVAEFLESLARKVDRPDKFSIEEI